jgi:hypothetical protein
MPWIGSAPSKTFQRTDGTRTGTQTWQEADVAGVDIVSPDHDVHDQDIADGLQLCVLRDGGNTAVANLPMGGFRHSNVGDGLALNQYGTLKQFLNNAVQYCGTAGGTANALTVSTGFTATTYVAGMTLSFIVGTTNTGATTISVDSLAAKSLVRADGLNTALAAGDLVAGSLVEIQYDGTRFQLRSSSQTATTSDVLARVVKAGSIIAWPSATVPGGWLECLGQAVARATYPELDSNMYVGDGANATAEFFYRATTTVNPSSNRSTTGDYIVLPDMINRTVFGQDTGATSTRITTAGSGINGDTLGASGGGETVTLARANLPNEQVTGTTNPDGAHNHTYVRFDTDSSSGFQGGSTGGFTETSTATSVASNHTHTFSANLNGGVTQTAVNKMPPGIILKWIILANPAAASASTLGVNGFQYAWNTATSGDPGAGLLLVNNATPASATALNISETDGNASSIAAFLATIDDSSSTINGYIHIYKIGAPGDFIIYSTSGSLTDSGGYDTITVSHVASNGTFANGQNVAVLFSRTGDKGDTGDAGTPSGLRWAFDSSTSMADPGTGDIRLNHGTLSSVTAAAISDLCAEVGNPDASAWVLAWDDPTSTVRGTLKLTKEADQENFAIYSITGASTDNSGWTELALTHVTSNGTLSDTDVLVISHSRTGDVGASGATGTDAGIRFNFDSSTSMADPGAGDIRLNNASFASVTAIAVDDTSAESGNPDVSAYVLTWDDSTTTALRGTITIKKLSAPENFAIYSITNNSTDNSGWTELAVTHVVSNGSFSNTDALSVAFTRTGDKGTDGAGAGDVTAASSFGTDNVLIRSDGTGKGVQSTGITVADTTNDLSGVGSITPVAGSAVRTATSDTNTLLFQAYDVNDTTYRTFGTLTAGNTATCTWGSTGLGITVTHLNTGLKIEDSNASHALTITTSSNLTDNRSLTLVPGDSDRTVTISGNATISQDYSSTGSPTFATPTVTGVNIGSTSTTLTEYAAGVLGVEGAAIYPGVPVTNLSAATTFDITHANQLIVHPSSDNNARTFTIPANGTVAYPVGTVIQIFNAINTVSIAITTDTLTLAGPGSTGGRSLAANGLCTIQKIASTSWIISGTGLS